MANTIDLQFEREFIQAYQPAMKETMVDWERCYSVWKAVNHILDADLPGALVECGVWRGGVCMMMANALRARGVSDRDIWMYDTFAGMAEPTKEDVGFGGQVAHEKWQEQQQGDKNGWCYAPIEEVAQNMQKTGYTPERMRLIKGKVQDTIPAHVPDQIALLRLDTDWYESTYHELTHLYPRLVEGGVVIFDDAFHWQGQRKAMDQYFAEQGISLYMTRVAVSMVGIKVGPHGLSKAEREAAELPKLAG